MLDFITLTDGYKLDHRRQYPEGTEYVYSNFTARSTRIGGADSVVFFGLQYFLKAYLQDLAQATFFERPKAKVLDGYRRFLDSYLGENAIGVDHIAALHDLEYIPLQFWALPEGTAVPFRMPMFTLQNTHPEFFWVTNYIETLLSSVLWLPCTSASTARRYRKLLTNFSYLTGADPAFVAWQGHDFSFRGMACPEAAALSGAGHLLSFTGTDSIPSIQLLSDYYDGAGLVGGSVPATEHSVMCAGGQADEMETFNRLLKLYPKGILSVVSDTWDLWHVLDTILPKLKTEILARDGKLVIRPDSGDPVLILTGDATQTPGTLPHKGVVEALWDLFGGSVNSHGYRELSPKIGAIYGDSINEDRAQRICLRLMDKGFASTNVVFGIGSFTYQYVTRDTNGFAVKATWAQVKGVERLLSKNPVTDSGEKKSAKGRIVVVQTPTGLRMIDCLTLDGEREYDPDNLLSLVWKNGRFVRRQTLADIRSRLNDAPAKAVRAA
jgi:nicotinamide phosphoribosyltransferase